MYFLPRWKADIQTGVAFSQQDLVYFCNVCLYVCVSLCVCVCVRIGNWWCVFEVEKHQANCCIPLDGFVATWIRESSRIWETELNLSNPCVSHFSLTFLIVTAWTSAYHSSCGKSEVTWGHHDSAAGWHHCGLLWGQWVPDLFMFCTLYMKDKIGK